MADENQEKTEDPTSRKKRKAREDGNVSQSQEVNSTIIFAVSVLIFSIAGSFMMGHLKQYMIHSLSSLTQEITASSIVSIFYIFIQTFSLIIAPLAFTLLIAAFIASYIQYGWLWSTKALEWKWENLVKFDFKQIFSGKALLNLLKDTIKIILLMTITYVTMKKELLNIMNYIDMDIQQIFSNSAKLVIKLIK